MESDLTLLKPFDPYLGEVVAVKLLSDSIQNETLKKYQ